MISEYERNDIPHDKARMDVVVEHSAISPMPIMSCISLINHGKYKPSCKTIYSFVHQNHTNNCTLHVSPLHEMTDERRFQNKSKNDIKYN